jgi:hypothetical protein
MEKEQLIWYPTADVGYITKDMWKYIHKIQELMNYYKLIDNHPAYILNRLFNYSLRTTDENCGGYCAFDRRVIAVNPSFILPENLLSLKHILAHEIGHAIQAELEVFETEERLLSNRYHIELQAESLGSVMFDIIFPNDKKDPKEFNIYFNKESLLFLRDWYSDSSIQNDLVEELKIMK